MSESPGRRSTHQTWIRVVIYDSESPASGEEYIKQTAQNVVRTLEKVPGCTLGYWGEDPETGKMAAITFWNSRESIEAARPTLATFAEERKKLGVEAVSEDNFLIRPVSPLTMWDRPSDA